MIGVVVPVYNEGAVIERTLTEIQKKIHPEYTVYIVYDFAEDNTLPVVRRWVKQNPCDVRLIQNHYGHGALNAIKTGFRVAEADAVLVVMAELSDDLSGVDLMYELMEKGYDLVCGSRYCSGGKQIGGPLLKRTMSRLAGLSLNWLIRIPTHDVTNSFKLYKKDLLDSIQIESRGGFELGMEIAIKAYLQGKKVGEVPATWTDRTEGESRFRLWAWLPRYISWYLYGLRGYWGRRKTKR